MKILVLQLARLGDIYQSWPALRALRRNYPDAQIDVMVRPRFEDALTGNDSISKKILLPSQELLAPLVTHPQDINGSVLKLEQFLGDLRKTNYDWIINLSFSPLSSYISHSLKTELTQISGYTRHDDGFFNMSGEISSYFYAQVGVGRFNRFHVTDLFAGLMGVETIEEDWRDADVHNSNLKLPAEYITIHIGASEEQKSLPAFKWSRIIKYFNQAFPDIPVVLIGSPEEKHLAEFIMAGKAHVDVIDLVGKTRVSELFPILRGASLFVGCDSAPIHIASLTRTPCLNISLGNVNFWETGPRSPISYIFCANTADQVVAEYVSILMKDIVEGREPKGLIKHVSGSPCYEISETEEQRFCWDLIQALYLGQDFPMAQNIKFLEGCEKMNEINGVILEQLEQAQRVGIDKVKTVLDRSDEVIYAISDLVPQLQVYTRWLRAERARVQPGPVEDILTATLNMHKTLKTMLRPYILDEAITHGGEAHG